MKAQTTGTQFLFLLAALVGVAVVPTTASPVVRNAKCDIERIASFGDSYTDGGHGTFGITNGTWPADPAYYEAGARRFSNGPLWVQQLANKYGVGLDDNGVGGGTSSNKMVQGGTGYNNSIPVPSALNRTQDYLASGNLGNIHKTLFTILIGANDALSDRNVTVKETLSNMHEGVDLIAKKGGKNILLASYPSIDRFPFIININDTAQTNFLRTFSKDISNGLSSYAKSRKDVKIIYADVFGLCESIRANPKKYGFQVLNQQCLKGVYAFESTVKRSVCADPEKYFFWDAIHPTTKAHV